MPTQRFSKQNVVEAARARMAFVFDHFENIIVSVSGGKDSTCCVYLALTEAAKRGRRVGVFFLDEEVVYQSTVDQVERIMAMAPESTKRMWLQIPFYLTNATSVTDGQLRCWEPGEHKIWMRPKGELNMKGKPWADADEKFKSGYSWLDFYGVLDNFERTQTNTALLVGLRAAGESPNRWRAVTKNPVRIGDRNVYWATRKGANVAMYPLYDWNAHDVWRFIWDERIPYSHVYDMMFRKGYPLNEMRVSSLIHERAFRSICDLPEFEPKTYNQLIKRIKGIALAQETGKAAKLFRCRKLPKNFSSWITYRDFLLETHLDRVRLPIFLKRFARQLVNEHVARQQCRQLILNDYEGNLPIDNSPDPREELVRYYDEVL